MSDLLVNNDNVLLISGLRNEVRDEYINDGIVSVTLSDMADNPIPGQAWPMQADYVLESDGVYRLLLENTLQLVGGHYYKLTVNVEGGGLSATWSLILKAVSRAE